LEEFLIKSGVEVSENTLTRIFEEVYPYNGKLYAVNLIPLEKSRERNLERAEDFILLISKFPMKKRFFLTKNY